MTPSEEITRHLLLINGLIGLIFILLLQQVIHFFPRRAPTGLQLCVAFAGTYALAIAINIVLPDLFDAIGALVSAQPVCAKSIKSCYAFGGATWTDNITLQNRLALVVCNGAWLACWWTSVVGFFARVAGYFM